VIDIKCRAFAEMAMDIPMTIAWAQLDIFDGVPVVPLLCIRCFVVRACKHEVHERFRGSDPLQSRINAVFNELQRQAVYNVMSLARASLMSA
jgi:hypothetical protein